MPLEKKYPEAVFLNICKAVGVYGIDGVGLIIKDWEAKTPESSVLKGRFTNFYADLKSVAKNCPEL